MPCGNAGEYPYVMYFSSATTGWLGCNGGTSGSVYKTTNGGTSWTEETVNGRQDVRVFDIATDSTGNVYLCGFDNQDETNPVYVYKYSGSSYSAFLDKTTIRKTATQSISNCGQMEIIGSQIIVDSLTGNEIVYSSDSGANWTRDEEWEDNNITGSRQAYQMWRLTSANGKFYGTGSISIENPLFFGTSSVSGAQFFNLNKNVVTTNLRGIARAMATTDCGTTWLVGGKDDDDTKHAAKFIYRSTDSGATWSSATISDPDSVLDVVEDMACDATGNTCIAVGHKYPETKGGYILISSDAGKTWSELTSSSEDGTGSLDLSDNLMKSVTIRENTFWAAGEESIIIGTFTKTGSSLSCAE